MDLLTILKEKIDKLPPGEHSTGLNSVFIHTETAYRHLTRGQKEEDITAFTDSIYRTNQAYEGSVKEAYRVLAGKDPYKKTPYEIEEYLTEENVLRRRVLSQLKQYRTDWRNPSTHDYNLDFDENESLLAIVSVIAFSIVLVDQISERISFIQSSQEAEAENDGIAEQVAQTVSLMEKVKKALNQFSRWNKLQNNEHEVHTVGRLAGYLQAALPGVFVNMNPEVPGNFIFQPDILLEDETSKVILEVTNQNFKEGGVEQIILRMKSFMDALNTPYGIIYDYSKGPPSVERIFTVSPQNET